MDLHPGTKTYRVAEVKFADLDPIRQALHENADWYQDLVEHSQDLLCIHDLQGRLLSVNPAPARVLGYSVEELLKIPMRELIVPEFRADFDAYLKDIAITGESHGWMGVVTRSGEQRIWEYHNTLRTEGVASPIVRGMARDVTEQRRAEQLAREANETLHNQARENERTIEELKLFRTLVDQSNDAIEVVDPETLRFLDVNEKACSDLGYSREELLSLRVFDIDPAVTESSMVPIKAAMAGNGIAGDGKRPSPKGRIDLPGGSEHEAGSQRGAIISLPSPATLPSASRPKRNLRSARAAIALFMKFPQSASAGLTARRAGSLG